MGREALFQRKTGPLPDLDQSLAEGRPRRSAKDDRRSKKSGASGVGMDVPRRPSPPGGLADLSQSCYAPGFKRAPAPRVLPMNEATTQSPESASPSSRMASRNSRQ